jgi:oligopeptide transport system substrate-binding protein
LGNGPFTLVEWRPDVHLIVQKNPLHWDAPRNRLDRIVFGPTSSSEVEELNFRMGQIHVTCSLPKAKIGYYREHEPARLRIEPIFRSSYLQFNTTKAPFNQQKVRRALALAIDRTRLARAVLGDAGRPAEHVTPPDCGGYTTRARVPTDFAAARRLLAEAGFPAGQDLPAVTLQIYGSQKIAEVIQETWRRELGIVCTIDQGEIKAVLQDIQALQYSVGMGGWTADFTDPATFLEVFVTNGKENKTGWGNPDYDRLIAKAAHTLDPARRLEVFQEAEALLLEEAPIAPLLFGSQTYLIHPAVKGWVFAPLGLRRYHHVWLEK